MRLINLKPSRPIGLVLGLVPFILVALAYGIASEMRLAENPNDRVLPSPATIVETAQRLISEPDRRKGIIVFWQDTWASLYRLALGVGIASFFGLIFGLGIGLFPIIRNTLNQFVAALSLIPPLAIMPIILIAFGVEDTMKVILIVVGILPFIIRDLSQRTLEIPEELIVKSQTLGASSGVIALRLALPLVMPRLIQAVRLSLGPAWLFLLAAEFISAKAGLGYQIFISRRYLAMDVIIVYVLWITILAFLLDGALRLLSRWLYPWAERTP